MRHRRYQDLLIALSLSAGGLCATTLPMGMVSSDWSSITKEYQRHRHAAFPVDAGGYKARGWEQQWVARFDGRGFEVIPDEAVGVGGCSSKAMVFAALSGTWRSMRRSRPMWSESATDGLMIWRSGL
jgi:hypothetical protein